LCYQGHCKVSQDTKRPHAKIAKDAKRAKQTALFASLAIFA